MIKPLSILIIIVSLISCRGEVKKNAFVKLETAAVNLIQKDTFSFNGAYTATTNLNLASELRVKLEKLADLENHYQILEIEKSSFKESIICRGIERLPKLSSEKNFFLIKNLDRFEEGIEEINYAYIKGTKDMGGQLFPRAKVEELIFNSEEIANRLVEFVHQIKENGITWEDIDKSPSSIFSDKNKVYYISAGGWYMKPFCKEIENKMKK